MSDYEVSREDLLRELKKDLESGKSAVWKTHAIRLSKPMSNEEFFSRRNALKMTRTQLAQVLDISITTVQAYEQGKTAIPGLVAKVLRKMENQDFREIFISEEIDAGSAENLLINKKYSE